MSFEICEYCYYFINIINKTKAIENYSCSSLFCPIYTMDTIKNDDKIYFETTLFYSYTRLVYGDKKIIITDIHHSIIDDHSCLYVYTEKDDLIDTINNILRKIEYAELLG